jgi:hypothetical protein
MQSDSDTCVGQTSTARAWKECPCIGQITWARSDMAGSRRCHRMAPGVCRCANCNLVIATVSVTQPPEWSGFSCTDNNVSLLPSLAVLQCHSDWIQLKSGTL